MLTEELLTYIFDGTPHSLSAEMAKWLAKSRRYTEFVTTFRDKIRKKLRTTPDPENLLDLRMELETAYLLLQERRLTVAYEPLPAREARSPDFGVTYTSSLTFMVEVTRLRAATSIEAATSSTTPTIDERLVDTICGKLGQLLAAQSNVLLIGMEAEVLSALDLEATMRHIRQRAERNDPTFFQRTHFRARADFFRHYPRLSEILVRATHDITGAPRVWVNPQAKQPLPSKVRTALYRSHTI